MKKITRITLVVALFIAFSAHAYTWNNIDFHGFFGQGFMLSSHNNYYGSTTDGSFHLAEAALSATHQINDKWRVGGQLYTFRLGDVGAFDRPFIDWLYIDYAWKEGMGFRVGKVKTPQGIYGEFRDIDMARTGVFLPSNIYDPIFRDMTDSIWGVSVYGNVPLKKGGSLDYNLGFGMSQARDNGSGVDYTFTQTSPENFESFTENYALNGQLAWNTPVTGLRAVSSFNYTRGLMFKGKFKSAAQIALLPPPSDDLAGLASVIEGSNMVIRLPYYVSFTLGAEYLWNAWTFATEFQRQDLKQFMTVDHVAVAGTPAFNGQASTGSTIDSLYLYASRRINPKLEVGGYGALYYANIHDRDGSGYAADGDHDYHAFQKELVGVARYHISSWWEVKIEAHLIDGVGRVSNITGNQPWSDVKQHWFFGALKSTIYF